MSYSVNTCVAPFCHSQDHSGGVPVAPSGMSAGLAMESSHVQFKPLGSRKAFAARHGRVRGLHHHHLSASPSPSFKQFAFGRTNGRVGSLAGHRGFGEELRPEVLNCDQSVVVHNVLGPYPRVVPGLAGGFLVQLGGLTFRVPVAPRLATAFAVSPKLVAAMENDLGYQHLLTPIEDC